MYRTHLQIQFSRRDPGEMPDTSRTANGSPASQQTAGIGTTASTPGGICVCKSTLRKLGKKLLLRNRALARRRVLVRVNKNEASYFLASQRW